MVEGDTGDAVHSDSVGLVSGHVADETADYVAGSEDSQEMRQVWAACCKGRFDRSTPFHVPLREEEQITGSPGGSEGNLEHVCAAADHNLAGTDGSDGWARASG